MWNFLLYGPKRDPEPGAAGGDSPLDPGAPFVHGEPVKPAAKPNDKSDLEKRFDALEAETKGLRTRLTEAEGDARYWSQRARGEAAPREERETDDEPPAEDPTQEMTPEQFLDVLSKEGIKGLKRFGFMTKADVDAEVKRISKEADQKISRAQQASTIDQKIGREFPDLIADNDRVQRGEKPQTEMYKRTGKILQELVADDPSLKNSTGALMAAARMAKQQLDAEKKAGESSREDRDDRQQQRRERIENQRGERDRPRDDEREPVLPALAGQVISNLERFGAKVEDYTKGRSNGR